jgi:hypothetical protein
MTINPLDVVTYPVILAAAAGSTPIVAGVTGQRWCCVGFSLTPAAVGGTFQVLSGVTAITGIIVLPAAGLTVGDGESVVWMSRASGEALNIDPAAQNLDGWVNVVMLK